jgi:hypothetical protein
VDTIAPTATNGDASTFTLPSSDAQTPAGAGTYCYNASYSGDSNYAAVSEQTGTECFAVLPTLSIAQNPVSFTEGQSGSDQASANSGSSSVTFSEVGAPGNIIMNPTSGLLSGTPGYVGGQFSVTITATVGGASNSLGLTLYVIPTNTLHVTTNALPNAQKGASYSATLTAAGGTPGYKWKISSGTLPHGLHLDRKTGVISGIPPSSAITETLTAKVKDHSHPKQTAQATFTITVT